MSTARPCTASAALFGMVRRGDLLSTRDCRGGACSRHRRQGRASLSARGCFGKASQAHDAWAAYCELLGKGNVIAFKIRAHRPVERSVGKVAERIYDICRFAVLDSDRIISLDRRRRTSRVAPDLSRWRTDPRKRRPRGEDLRDLAGRKPGWRTVPNVSGGNRLAGKLTAQLAKIGGPAGLSAEFHETSRTRPLRSSSGFTTLRDWGGNRRSGERSLKSSELVMTCCYIARRIEARRCRKWPVVQCG